MMAAINLDLAKLIPFLSSRSAMHKGRGSAAPYWNNNNDLGV
jgi:hypothetical protein